MDFQEEFNQCTSGCRFVDAEKTIKLLQSTLVFKLVIINIDELANGFIIKYTVNNR